MPTEAEIKDEVENIGLKIDTGSFVQVLELIKCCFLPIVTNNLSNSNVELKENLVV
jgi:hypothetical protein